MLSNVDIKKELGENIYIYPFNEDNIRGGTINLSASNMAWTIEGENILGRNDQGKEEIVIPARKSAVIETNEVIYVTYKLAGTYHSKVGMVSRGAGHIGTTLDPGFIGSSLITVHNHSDQPLRIKVGESFVSLTLHYLDSISTYKNTNESGQITLLQHLNIHLSDEELSKLKEEWRSNPEKLKMKMLADASFTSFKIRREEEEKDKRRITWKKIMLIIKIYWIPLIILFALGVVFYFIGETAFKWYITVGLSGTIAAVFSIIVGERTKKFIN